MGERRRRTCVTISRSEPAGNQHDGAGGGGAEPAGARGREPAAGSGDGAAPRIDRVPAEPTAWGGGRWGGERASHLDRGADRAGRVAPAGTVGADAGEVAAHLVRARSDGGSERDAVACSVVGSHVAVTVAPSKVKMTVSPGMQLVTVAVNVPPTTTRARWSGSARVWPGG